MLFALCGDSRPCSQLFLQVVKFFGRNLYRMAPVAQTIAKTRRAALGLGVLLRILAGC